MLEKIGELDSDRCNVVSFKERFDHMGLTCLIFEMLDISLWNLVIDHKRALSPSEIRPIAQQLLVAFDTLKDIGVIHSDLKPDNIMLTNRKLEPYRVKLIDFGLARNIAEVRQGQKKQPSGYRAPEVTLGCEFDVPIDMWGLGSTLALLLLKQHLFPDSGYQSVKMMVDLLGMPPANMLRDGVYSQYYFTKEDDDQRRPTWRLLTPEEFITLDCVIQLGDCK
uniref:Protein kinase domain-containing protein n=1 Tax=Neogobius melanostomus TaxID=47308 RepID=A0A8C6V0Y9_9GOBI